MRIIFTLLSFLCLLASPAGMAQPTAAAGTIVIASDGSQITYHAQAGDTLSSIAERLTSRAANWVALGKLNRINQDISIPIGTAIVIPAELLPDEPNSARVIAFSGHVSASAADGSAVRITPGALLHEGASLKTGPNSFLTLALADQSRISIPSLSNIQLSRLRMARHTRSPRTEISILRGRVESRVAPLKRNQGRFDVRTPHSVTGVRGTHFRVALQDGRSSHAVLNGSVVVSHANGVGSLLLAAGQGASMQPGQLPTATPLLPAPQLASAPVTTTAGLRFELLPLAGASGYQVQIATDNEGQNIVAENRSDGPRVTLSGLADGHYFARLSALDGAGLEGHSRSHRVLLPARSAPRAAPAAPFVDDSERAKLLLRWEGAPGQRFLIQVARDPVFSWLLLSATTEQPEIRLTRPAFGTYYARVQLLQADAPGRPFSLAQAFVVTDHWTIHDGAPFAVGDSR